MLKIIEKLSSLRSACNKTHVFRNNPSLFLLIWALSFQYSFSQLSENKRFEILFNQNIGSSFNSFKEFLSIPNNANNIEDMDKNKIWCQNEFKRRGFTVEEIKTDRLPLLLAQKGIDKNKKTILFYLQIDGQPVQNELWNQENPFKPVLKELGKDNKWNTISWQDLKGDLNPEWRIFARSASDAKGPVLMLLTAIDLITQMSIKPNFNIKVIMDFEEELGSPRLGQALKENRFKLFANELIVLDGPQHMTNRPTLIFGARGIALFQLEVYGAKSPLHSGNYAPNAALKLSKLITSMYAETGRVTIDHWYDSIVIRDKAKDILNQVPDNEKKLIEFLGTKSREHIADTFQESMQFPTLSILGLKSGWVGNETRTIIPERATVEFNIRLVKETKGERMMTLVKNHIQNLGYHIVTENPNEQELLNFENVVKLEYKIAYEAFRTEFDSDLGIRLNTVLAETFGETSVIIPTVGGSVPISPFAASLGIPAVIVPTVNPDNNQHSPNENIRIGNYVAGIRTIYAILKSI